MIGVCTRQLCHKNIYCMSYTYCSGFNLSNLSHIQTARTDNCQTHKSGQLVRTNRSGYANRPDTRAACGDKFGARKSSGHTNQGSFSGQIVQGMQIVWTHTNPGRLVRTNSGHANRPDTIRTHTQIRAAFLFGACKSCRHTNPGSLSGQIVGSSRT